MRYLREGTSGINKEEKWGEHQQQEPKDDIVHVVIIGTSFLPFGRAQ